MNSKIEAGADRAGTDLVPQETGEWLEALQAVSSRPLVLRQVPIREGDQISGFVDLPPAKCFSTTFLKRSNITSRLNCA